jgi:hypothetical protein
MAVFFLNMSNLRTVKSARQSNAATLCLQERAEQLRLADWRKITDPVYLRDTLLANSTKSAGPLSAISEKIIVTAFPDEEAAQQLVVVRNTNGSRVVLLSGDGLAAQRLAKIDLQVSWQGTDGRTRTRATTTLMTNGGISRMNLPGFGAAAGAPPPESTPAPTVTPAPTATPNPSSTPDPSSPPATPTPTPTATPKKEEKTNNGQHRGTVAGEPGQG